MAFLDCQSGRNNDRFEIFHIHFRLATWGDFNDCDDCAMGVVRQLPWMFSSGYSRG
jgi:hypothetical protein